MERTRSVNVESLSAEQADILSAQIGEKVRLICDEACKNANKYLNIYGMKAQMQIAIAKIDEDFTEQKLEKPKKKRGRPRKDANLK